MSVAWAPPMTEPFLTLGDWTIRPAERAIERRGERLVLEPRCMDVLLMLTNRAGEVASSEELLATCWPGDAYGDNPVHKCVAMLRKALGDDVRTPRYIETIRKRGYRVVAATGFSDGRERAAPSRGPWLGGSPYPGARPFTMHDAPVFFGRRKHRHALLTTIKAAHDEKGAFVIVHGPPGCGSTSLVQAGVIPSLLSDTGYDGLRAVACAAVALTQGKTAVMDALAHAICQWRIGGRALFMPDESEVIAGLLRDNIEVLFRRLRAPLRVDGDVLLLVVDDIDGLVASADRADALIFLRTLALMARSRMIVILATCRVAALSELGEVAQDLDTRDIATPYALDMAGPGELANMIRRPAACAGVIFEEDTITERRLDDVLLADAIQSGCGLSELQRVLRSIFLSGEHERLMTFDAYQRCATMASNR